MLKNNLFSYKGFHMSRGSFDHSVYGIAMRRDISDEKFSRINWM